MKGKLILIHWKALEAEALATPLRRAGWQVDVEAEDGARAGKAIGASPPDAVYTTEEGLAVVLERYSR